MTILCLDTETLRSHPPVILSEAKNLLNCLFVIPKCVFLHVLRNLLICLLSSPNSTQLSSPNVFIGDPESFIFCHPQLDWGSRLFFPLDSRFRGNDKKNRENYKKNRGNNTPGVPYEAIRSQNANMLPQDNVSLIPR